MRACCGHVFCTLGADEMTRRDIKMTSSTGVRHIWKALHSSQHFKDSFMLLRFLLEFVWLCACEDKCDPCGAPAAYLRLEKNGRLLEDTRNQ